MKTKTSPAEIWEEYQKALAYNGQEGVGLTETVRRNENFMNDRQWEGLETPDLPQPVLNILRQVTASFVSNIVSDDISVGVNEFAAGGGAKPLLDMLSGEFAKVMELSGFGHKSRDVVRNAAVDGDGCVHYYFVPGEEGEDWTPGHIEAEILDNTAVYFGNPQESDVEKQPFIIIQQRRFVEDVRQAAEDGAGIAADEDQSSVNRDREEDKVTVLRKYYKKGGEVYVTEATASAVVKKPVSLGYRRYPLAWMPWVKVKNSYHGVAAITGMIPNQIFVNKLLAMAMQHLMLMAFPKVVYNNQHIDEWTNRVGGSIGVPGDPREAVAAPVQVPDMSNQVFVAIDKVIQYTRETMGASDAFLGNVKPENTSAIVATQKATGMPLELQKMDFYRVVEDSVRVWLEMMAENYGVRPVEMNVPEGGGLEGLPGFAGYYTGAEVALYGAEGGEDAAGDIGAMEPALLAEDAGALGMEALGLPAGEAPMPGAAGDESAAQVILFDFSVLKGMNLRLNVDIGAGSYWSELMQVQTLDNLLAKGVIQDPELYIELMPSAYLPNKSLLLEGIRKKKAETEAAAREQMMLEQGPAPAEGGAELATRMPGDEYLDYMDAGVMT